MNYVRLTALIGLVAVALPLAGRAYELNEWPVYVAQKDPDGTTRSWSGAEPFLFSEQAPAPDAGTTAGLRPFYVTLTGGGSVKTDILYPLFYYRKYPEGNYKWSILSLINDEGLESKTTDAGGPKDKHFDVWPFYFSHETGDPIDTYHALFPIVGTIKYRLGFDKLQWAPFPIYVETVKKDTRTIYVPWPIFSVVSGAANGFAVWPLYGSTKGPGVASNTFYLWPLAWNNVLEPKLDSPAGTPPGTEVGFLPFFTRETAPGYISENYAWPFFGFTERTSPYRYSEERYLWPFFVQGRGEDHYVNRWGPFYTHSLIKGEDNTWVGWPFWHRKTWVDDDIRQTKTQFFYFVYWSLEQESVTRRNAAHAYKRHIWPFASIWDNGAGSRQVEFPSPLEVFFPDNPDMRAAWTPLFSVYRYSHQPTGEERTSVLWNAITWRRNEGEGLVELHIGPIVGMRRAPGGNRWSILGFDLGSSGNKDRIAKRS
jgi:hypothetical protein